MQIMRTLLFSSVVLLGVACTAPRHLPRAPLAAPPTVRSAPVERAVPSPLVVPVSVASVRDPAAGDAAVVDQEPELRTTVVYRSVVERVEVPVERVVEVPVVVGGDVVARRPRRSRGTFPLHTALGAGVGAIIGHQHGRRGRGAWIGGGVGLLFDLMHASRR